MLAHSGLPHVGQRFLPDFFADAATVFFDFGLSFVFFFRVVVVVVVVVCVAVRFGLFVVLRVVIVLVSVHY